MKFVDSIISYVRSLLWEARGNRLKGTNAENCLSLQTTEVAELLRQEWNQEKNGEITPEMRAIAYALTHPEGDPYENGRKLGFYCENCG